MKKIIKKFYALVGLFGFLSLPAAALADDSPLTALKQVTQNSYSQSTNQLTLAATLGTIVQVVLSLLGIVFIILIIYAGIIWMTAEGDEAKVEKAQKILRNSIIGLLITLSSWAIYLLVETAFPK
jgi:hypothetical protein